MWKMRLQGLLMLVILLAFTALSPHQVAAQDDLSKAKDIEWSPDSSKIAVLQDDTISIWDGTTAQLITSFSIPDGTTSMAWSPDGMRFALTSGTETIQVVKGNNGQNIGTLSVSLAPNETLTMPQIGKVAWSPDGEKLAAIAYWTLQTSQAPCRGCVRMVDGVVGWNVGTKQQMELFDQCGITEEFSTPEGYVPSRSDYLHWNADNQRLLWGTGNASVCDLQTGQIQTLFPSIAANAYIQRWNEESNKIATFRNGKLEFYSVGVDAQPTNRFDLYMDASYLSLAPNWQYLAAVGTAGQLRLWTLPTDQKEPSLTDDNTTLSFPGRKFAIWSSDSTRLATLDANSHLVIVNVPPPGVPVPQATTAAESPSATATVPAANSACPGSVASRLTKGQQARVVPSWASNLRVSPSESADRTFIVAGRGVVMLLDGPQCADNFLWWQVSYNGQTGWTAEGNATDYWLEPLPASETSTDCPGAAPQRLQVGAQAKQALTRDPLIAKSDPTATDKLFFVNPGAIVDVVAGPLCYPVSGLSTSWWQVKNADGMTGWVAESGPTKYYFEPYPAS